MVCSQEEDIHATMTTINLILRNGFTRPSCILQAGSKMSFSRNVTCEYLWQAKTGKYVVWQAPACLPGSS